jgi:hypothetical protein
MQSLLHRKGITRVKKKKDSSHGTHQHNTISVHENQQKATEKKKALTRVEEAQICTCTQLKRFAFGFSLSKAYIVG